MLVVSLGLAITLGRPARADEARQRVLGPGLYIYQTRVRIAECGDAERTGYVSTFMAAIDGVPGDRTMTMTLINSKYWPVWELRVNEANHLMGKAMLGGKPQSSAYSKFDMELDAKHRFTGVGTRYYDTKVDGQPRRCSVTYDVLLKPLS